MLNYYTERKPPEPRGSILVWLFMFTNNNKNLFIKLNYEFEQDASYNFVNQFSYSNITILHLIQTYIYI